MATVLSFSIQDQDPAESSITRPKGTGSRNHLREYWSCSNTCKSRRSHRGLCNLLCRLHHRDKTRPASNIDMDYNRYTFSPSLRQHSHATVTLKSAHSDALCLTSCPRSRESSAFTMSISTCAESEGLFSRH
jgi:hypothetical protein